MDEDVSKKDTRTILNLIVISNGGGNFFDNYIDGQANGHKILSYILMTSWEIR